VKLLTKLITKLIKNRCEIDYKIYALLLKISKPTEKYCPLCCAVLCYAQDQEKAKDLKNQLKNQAKQ
jgi:hypothetical protein